MTDEAVSYNKYEVQSLLNINHTDEFKLERIFNVYKQLGGEQFYYNILKKIEFPKEKSKTTYSNYYAKPGDVWTLISFNYYRRTDLWWLIAMFNDISDTFRPIPAGARIKIPLPSYVRVVFDAIKNQI